MRRDDGLGRGGGGPSEATLYNYGAALKRFGDYLDADVDADDGALSHNFRHSAVTRMWREGYDKQEIQHRVQWTLDTNMWERYVHVTAEEMTEEIFDTAGVVDSEDAHSVERDTCGNCRETVAPHAEYCPACGEPQSVSARDTRGAIITDIARSQADIGDLGRREFRALVLRKLADLERDHDSIPSTDSSNS